MIAAATAVAEPGLGAMIGPAVTIAVALIGGLSLLIVRLTRAPVEVRDLWTENRALRTDLGAVEKKVNLLMRERGRQMDVNRIMGDGFDATWNYIEREAQAAGHPPRFTVLEKTAVERARALRDDVEAWDTEIPGLPAEHDE